MIPTNNNPQNNPQNQQNFNQQNNTTNTPNYNNNQQTFPQNNPTNIPNNQNNPNNFNQNYNNQQFNPNPQNPQPKDKSKIVKILLLLGIIFVIGLVVFLGIKLMSSTDSKTDYDNNNLDDYSSNNFGNDIEDDFQENTANNNIKSTPDFEIVKFVLATSLDEDFNYVPKQGNEFFIGEDMYIYAEITGFSEETQENGYKHSILESVYVYDNSGNVIENMSKTGLEQETNIYDKQNMNIQFSILNPILEELETGNYEIELVYEDLLSEEIISQKKEFIVTN